jgi:hypothetical protein
MMEPHHVTSALTPVIWILIFRPQSRKLRFNITSLTSWFQVDFIQLVCANLFSPCVIRISSTSTSLIQSSENNVNSRLWISPSCNFLQSDFKSFLWNPTIVLGKWISNVLSFCRSLRARHEVLHPNKITHSNGFLSKCGTIYFRKMRDVIPRLIPKLQDHELYEAY